MGASIYNIRIRIRCPNSLCNRIDECTTFYAICFRNIIHICCCNKCRSFFRIIHYFETSTIFAYYGYAHLRICWILTICIRMANRIATTITKQIMIEYGIGFTYQAIRISKPSPPRIIVPAPQVVQPRLLIKHIPTIAERLHLAQRFRQLAGTPQRRTPRIVAVADDGIAILIQNRNNIALQALDIRIGNSVVHHHRGAVLRIILNSASINRYFFPYIFQQISINPCILEQCTSR